MFFFLVFFFSCCRSTGEDDGRGAGVQGAGRVAREGGQTPAGDHPKDGARNDDHARQVLGQIA